MDSICITAKTKCIEHRKRNDNNEIGDSRGNEIAITIVAPLGVREFLCAKPICDSGGGDARISANEIERLIIVSNNP